MNRERTNGRIHTWLGWQPIGYVVDGERIVQHYALEQDYEIRGETRKAKKIVPFDELIDYYGDLLEMFEILLEAQLLYEIGVTKRVNYWDGEYYAIVKGKAGESVRIASNSPSSALAMAFVDYLDKYGATREY